MKLVAAKCPSCGANIKVDRSLKVTKYEYRYTYLEDTGGILCLLEGEDCQISYTPDI